MKRTAFLRSLLAAPIALGASACVTALQPAPDAAPKPCSDDEGDCDTAFMAVEDAGGHHMIYFGRDGTLRWKTTAQRGGPLTINNTAADRQVLVDARRSAQPPAGGF